MTKPREKSREELTAEMEDGRTGANSIRSFNKAPGSPLN